jgi:dTDP-4-dehydrorhamnose reductase
MRILITGASGLLGLNLALEAARDHAVWGQVNQHVLRTRAFTVLPADLLAPGAIERLLDESQPDWVIHCAALANVDACEADPGRARQLNSEVPGKLAAAVARGGARLVHISTDAVFDGQKGITAGGSSQPTGHLCADKVDSERAVAAADPKAIIARVNLFGWSLSGQRSLGEFFFYNLSAGKPVRGFTDVYFCPLLANDLGRLLLQMLGKELAGLYHVVSSQCLSKYDFGVAVANRFGLDASLISPASVASAGLTAARSPRLTLRSDKLAKALGEVIPSISTGIKRFYTLYQQGYPQFLKRLAIGD